MTRKIQEFHQETEPLLEDNVNQQESKTQSLEWDYSNMKRDGERINNEVKVIEEEPQKDSNDECDERVNLSVCSEYVVGIQDRCVVDIESDETDQDSDDSAEQRRKDFLRSFGNKESLKRFKTSSDVMRYIDLELRLRKNGLASDSVMESALLRSVSVSKKIKSVCFLYDLFKI